jgi:hypothetical protein
LVHDQDRAAEDAFQTCCTYVGQVISLAELAIEVTQQYQVIGQTKLRAPGIVRPGRIDADAKDPRIQRTELVDLFSELGKLVRSPRRKVENVGQQDDRTSGQGVRQAHALFAADWQFEIGRGITDRQAGHSRRDYRMHPEPRILAGLSGR